MINGFLFLTNIFLLPILKVMEEEQKVALPKRKLLFSKYSLVFLGLVVLVLLGEGIYWFRLGKKKEQQEVSPTSSPEAQTPLPTRDVNLIIQALWQGKRVSMGENMLADFANQ